MNDTTQTPATETATPATAEQLPPEIQYLKDHGEDITEYLPKPEGEQKPAETAPAGEQKAEPKTEDESEPGEARVGADGRLHDAKTGRYVPLKSLHEERARRQAAEKEASEHRERLARLDERLKLVQQPAKADDGKAKAPANPYEEGDIDPSQDLLGAFQQERRRNAWLREQHGKATQETTAALTEQNVYQAYRDDTATFMAKQPDYKQAFTHVVRARAMELLAMGVKQEDIAAQIKRDESDIVRQAIAARRSPAEVFYQLAVAKGYQAPQAQANPQPNPAPQPAAKPAEKTAAEQQIDAINAGQAAGKTLTGAGGGAPVGLTLEQFLSMDVDEIIKLRSTPQGQRQLAAIGAL